MERPYLCFPPYAYSTVLNPTMCRSVQRAVSQGKVCIADLQRFHTAARMTALTLSRPADHSARIAYVGNQQAPAHEDRRRGGGSSIAVLTAVLL